MEAAEWERGKKLKLNSIRRNNKIHMQLVNLGL
jgi:hypothetical protein